MDSAVLGVSVGLGLGVMLIIPLIWYILQVIADWKILSKAGQPGWLSFVPILNVYAEYELCWNGLFGVVQLLCALISGVLSRNSDGGFTAVISAILVVVACIIHIIQSFKLSKSFGKGIGYAIFLILFGPLARIILGLGSSRYIGKP